MECDCIMWTCVITAFEYDVKIILILLSADPSTFHAVDASKSYLSDQSVVSALLLSSCLSCRKRGTAGRCALILRERLHFLWKKKKGCFGLFAVTYKPYLMNKS